MTEPTPHLSHVDAGVTGLTVLPRRLQGLVQALRAQNAADRQRLAGTPARIPLEELRLVWRALEPEDRLQFLEEVLTDEECAALLLYLREREPSAQEGRR